jgi:uncharacterized protein YyaL (SSP411 family)
MADMATDTSSHIKPNSLINESSPYLLQHAYNPVQWYPWGNEALERARAEDKPILVSIGYSACHWCHVMEKECFENETVAQVMNENFINIKVDREERPDVDQIYMEALQTMNLRGGWPLNVFLTPQAKPFYGGTYFPATHWVNLLNQISTAFINNRNELEHSAEEFTRTLNYSEINKYGLVSDEPGYSLETLDAAYKKIEKGFDKKLGGMDRAPKFPMPSIYLFLLRYFELSEKPDALRQVKITLDKIAMGGIYDQAGGGFARYSSDAEWFAPHFEKMLYDNGQLITLYSEAFTVTGTPLYKKVVYQSIAWLQREMTSEEGAFFSALDADSEGEEGKFYVWTKDEIAQLFPDELSLVCDYYTIANTGNWENGHNILFRNLSDQAFANKHKINPEQLEKMVARWNATLLRERNKKIRPSLDDKILASWNGIMLKGLVDAGRAFDEPAFLEMAVKNAEFLRSRLRHGNKLYHTCKNGSASIEGYLEDYAFVIQGYISLYQATFDEQWLTEAQLLTDEAIVHFYNESEQLFYFTSISADPLIARKKEIFDNVIPSSNSVMAANLYWLSLLLESDHYKILSLSMLNRIKGLLPTEPNYLSNWACFHACLVTPTAEIAIAGDYYLEFRKELDKHFLFNAVFAGTKNHSKLPLLRNRTPKDGWETTIFVCFDRTCGLPVHNVEDALQQLNVLKGDSKPEEK